MPKFKPIIREQKDQKTQDGLYNVKIRISHKGKVRYIRTGFYVKPEQILSGEIVKHDKAKQYNIELRKTLNRYDNEILNLAGRIDSMDINALVSILKAGGKEKSSNFYKLAEDIKKQLRDQGRISYSTSITSTINQVKKFKGKYYLSFNDINTGWLEKFDSHLSILGKSRNTIAIYLRNIRMIYNQAIKKKLISRELYPFYDFKIKGEKTRKRSLLIEDLRRIRDVKPEKQNLQIARDLFMLSFYLNGINFKDLLLAKNANVYQERLIFNRYKTGRSYSIKIFPEAQKIIDRYRGKKYLLYFMERKVKIKKERSTPVYKDIVAQVNESLKLISDIPVSTYYARHSLATIAFNIGISRDDIRLILGHGQETVTDIYIDADIERIDRAMRRVLDEINQFF